MAELQREYDLDWSQVSDDMARQILHQGELYLATQVQTAIAADQRATTSASIFSGFAAALAVAFLAYASDKAVGFAATVGAVGAITALVVGAAAMHQIPLSGSGSAVLCKKRKPSRRNRRRGRELPRAN